MLDRIPCRWSIAVVACLLITVGCSEGTPRTVATPDPFLRELLVGQYEHLDTDSTWRETADGHAHSDASRIPVIYDPAGATSHAFPDAVEQLAAEFPDHGEAIRSPEYTEFCKRWIEARVRAKAEIAAIVTAARVDDSESFIALRAALEGMVLASIIESNAPNSSPSEEAFLAVLSGIPRSEVPLTQARRAQVVQIWRPIIWHEGLRFFSALEEELGRDETVRRLSVDPPRRVSQIFMPERYLEKRAGSLGTPLEATLGEAIHGVTQRPVDPIPCDQITFMQFTQDATATEVLEGFRGFIATSEFKSTAEDSTEIVVRVSKCRDGRAAARFFDYLADDAGFPPMGASGSSQSVQSERFTEKRGRSIFRSKSHSPRAGTAYDHFYGALSIDRYVAEITYSRPRGTTTVFQNNLADRTDAIRKELQPMTDALRSCLSL